MSATSTARFGLIKPTPGTSEPVASGASLNTNSDTIDANLGCFVCTSSTRPTGIEGRLIFETDTGAVRVYKASDSKWHLVNPIAVDATVLTSETTSSTSYVDLATVGPAVTVFLTAGQRAVVMTRARQSSGTATSAVHSYAVTGAETTSPSTGIHEAENLTASGSLTMSCESIFTASAVDGNRTFTMKYKVTSTAAGTWLNRYICVKPLSN